MSELLNQLKDDELDFTVCFTDTDGISGKYEFLDIVLYKGNEYVIVEPSNGDGYVDIFRIIVDAGREEYERVTDDEALDDIFDIFRKKNEDEFDFE